MKKIVLIDDSESDLLFSSLIVGRSGLGADVVEFDCARSALDHLQTPDGACTGLILLDLNMPDMDGFQFLQAYCDLHRTQQVQAPVVVLTSSPDPHDRAQAASFACVRGYLVKPIDLAAARSLQSLLDAPCAAKR